jgi:hypothetical protein
MIKTVRKVLPFVFPALKDYFTKNGGLNSVTVAASAGWLPVLLELLNSPSVNSGLEQLSQSNQTGAIIATLAIGVRAALGFWRMLKA